MLKNIITKLAVLSIIGVFVSTSVLIATEVAGAFFISAENKWVNATLTAESISKKPNGVGGTVIVTSVPWELRNIDGNLLYFNDEVALVVTFVEGKIVEENDDSERFGKIISTNDGLSIISDNEIVVEIYDLSGRCVYTTIGNNVSIEKNILNLKNGTYLLRLINEKGKAELTNFVFDGNSFIISK